MSRLELITSLVLAVSFITKISLSLHALGENARAVSSHKVHADSNLVSSLMGFFIMFAIYSYFIFFRSRSKLALSYKMTSLWLGMSAIAFVSIGILFSVQTNAGYASYKSGKEKAEHVLNIVLAFVCGVFLTGVVYKRLKA